MIHVYEEGKKDHPIFIVLHGTGGNEHDLIPLAKKIDEEASILSIRGDVSENGMARFFKRLRPGVFDEEDLIQRTHNLIDFLQKMADEYKFDKNNMIALGYSNGANIAVSVLFHEPKVLKGAILHHPMVPLKDIALRDMTKLKVFIGAGVNDPICSKEESSQLYSLFEGAGADVEINWFDQGHALTDDEIDAATSWYSEQFNQNKD